MNGCVVMMGLVNPQGGMNVYFGCTSKLISSIYTSRLKDIPHLDFNHLKYIGRIPFSQS